MERCNRWVEPWACWTCPYTRFPFFIYIAPLLELVVLARPFAVSIWRRLNSLPIYPIHRREIYGVQCSDDIGAIGPLAYIHTSAVRKVTCMNIWKIYQMNGPVVSRPNRPRFSMLSNIFENLPNILSASQSTMPLLSFPSSAPHADPTAREPLRSSTQHAALPRTVHISLTDTRGDDQSQFLTNSLQGFELFPEICPTTHSDGIFFWGSNMLQLSKLVELKLRPVVLSATFL